MSNPSEILSQVGNLTLTSGMCLPNSCNNNDAQIIAEMIFTKFNLNVTSTESRSDKDALPFRVRIMAVVIFGGLLLTVLSSTAYELVMIHRESKRIDCFVIKQLKQSSCFVSKARPILSQCLFCLFSLHRRTE